MTKTILVFCTLILFTGCTGVSNRKIVNARKGEALFKNSGCYMCHSIKGEKMYGPPLNQILHSNIVVIRNGVKRSVKVNREYIKRSIKNPDYEKVIDFQNRKMSIPELSNKDIDCIVDYLILLNEGEIKVRE